MGWDPFNGFKNIYSTCLLIFSLTIVMGLIGTSQTNLSSRTSPAVAYIMCWVALIWLTSVEGTQGSFVGLAPINPEIYKDSHPIAFMCNKVMVKGDNLDRYLMGRQLMVCCIVFIINYFSVFTMWVAMAGAESNSKEGPRSQNENIFYWGRCLMSLVILSFCGVVTVYALFTGQTTVWEGIPPIVSFIIFLILMSVVGMLEGMQIAFFACAKLRAEE